MRAEEDQDRNHRANHNIVAICDPENRHIEDEVAKRAAADAGDAGQEQKADDIELLARGGKRSGRGEDGYAGIVEKLRWGSWVNGEQ